MQLDLGLGTLEKISDNIMLPLHSHPLVLTLILLSILALAPDVMGVHHISSESMANFATELVHYYHWKMIHRRMPSSISTTLARRWNTVCSRIRICSERLWTFYSTFYPKTISMHKYISMPIRFLQRLATMNSVFNYILITENMTAGATNFSDGNIIVIIPNHPHNLSSSRYSILH